MLWGTQESVWSGELRSTTSLISFLKEKELCDFGTSAPDSGTERLPELSKLEDGRPRVSWNLPHTSSESRRSVCAQFCALLEFLGRALAPGARNRSMCPRLGFHPAPRPLAVETSTLPKSNARYLEF